MTRRTLLTLMFTSSAVLAISRQDAQAIFASGSIVHDPANFSQALLQVKTAYDQYAAQLNDYAQQLQHYKEMLTHTAQNAQNLVKTPLHIVAELDDVYQRYQATMGAANSIGVYAASAKAQFAALYHGQGSLGSAALVAKIRQMATQQRAADAEAARMQALRERANATQAQMRRALEAVRTANGNLGVQQAQGQLSGVMAQQQNHLIEIMAASQRAALSYQAQQTTLQEIVQADAQQAMANWSACPSCGTALPAFPQFQ